MIQRSLRLVTGSLLLLGLLSLASLGLNVLPAAAATPVSKAANRASTKDAASGRATIIVLDMSGSMNTNDPQGYRCSAADAYIDLSGVNDYVGVVGLDNNNGSRTGSHNFQTSIPWITPQSTGTVQDKQALKDAITTKSNKCNPDQNTPTYDSLSQAYDMLTSVTTQQKGLKGSVILLTDGAPCPDVDAQINAINSELLPKFQAKGWDINTIGLGQDGPIAGSCGGTLSGTFHDFLSGISSATGGKAYTDDKGVVPGVSPLNIAGFFVDIFARYSGETPTLAIHLTQLNGNTFPSNFPVADGATKLDIVAVKESANVSVTLENPSSQPISPGAGVFESGDNYHTIYSITDPPSGQWIATASGSGQFLLYSLYKTDIKASVDQVALKGSSLATPAALPLGQTLVVTAHLAVGGQVLSGSGYSVNGAISIGKAEDCANLTSPFVLTENAGTYTGTVNVPTTSPAGTYDVEVCVSMGSLQNVLSSESLPVRLEVFPLPYLYSSQTKQYTDTKDTPLTTPVVQWPLPLQGFYSIPIINHFSGWPLQGFPAQPSALLTGQVQWNGQIYQGASIRATAVPVNTCVAGLPAQTNVPGALPVTMSQDGQGNFTAQFQPGSAGLYQIIFETSGNFKDSQGSFGPSALCVQAGVAPATFDQQKTAYLVTFFYFFFLFFLWSLVHFFYTPQPFGQWVRNQGGASESNRSFKNAKRSNLWTWYFRRNQIASRLAGMPRGLEFRFNRPGHRIEVRPAGAGARDWKLTDGSPLSMHFQPARELVYRPQGTDENDYDSQTRFTIQSSGRSTGSSSSGGSFGDYGGGSGSRSAKGKGKGQPSYSGFAPYGTAPSRKGKPSSKGSRGRKGNDALPWENF